MNRHPEFKQSQRTRPNRVQKVTRAKANNTLLQQAAQKKRISPDVTTLLQPVRGLLICLGWLRLFQQIVAPRYALIPRRDFRRERYRG
jgi:hypothetical protein